LCDREGMLGLELLVNVALSYWGGYVCATEMAC
jgi:hypothetical protein